MQLEIFGIRHHGPGSAKSLLKALKAFEPDAILIEGPPDANNMIHHVANKAMDPPVALLVFNPKNLRDAVYFPFAAFSPEWQAIKFGLETKAEVRFIDLPQYYCLAPQPESSQIENVEEAEPAKDLEKEMISADPLGYLASLSGYEDSERWWEVSFEHREHEAHIFSFIKDMIGLLRDNLDYPEPISEQRREAFMRQSIRQAKKEGFEKIAVVCGAYHSPVLDPEYQAVGKDKALLKGLKKVATKSTWIPWSYERLSRFSGYGAGVISPAWYHFLFEESKAVVLVWMTQVARLMRKEDLDASSAHVIEAVRLAECLAALRELPIPGIAELHESAKSIFCGGYDEPMKLIEKKLIIGDRIGNVSSEIPQLPLQQDLEAHRCIKNKNGLLNKEYQAPGKFTKELNIREQTHIEVSHLLHRLQLLGIKWGKIKKVARTKKGSFHERWALEWKVYFSIAIIEAGMWGNTVYEAALNKTQFNAQKADSLSKITDLTDIALKADLVEVIESLILKIDELAAISRDIQDLMASLSRLVKILQIGSARGMNKEVIRKVVKKLVPRICISLSKACAGLNEETSRKMFNHFMETNQAIGILNDPVFHDMWQTALTRLTAAKNINPILKGASTRILFDKGKLNVDETASLLSFGLSTANNSASSAGWIEGFLVGSGLLLIHQPKLWQIVDDWVAGIPEPEFVECLPLIRRSFARFSGPEKEQMLKLASKGPMAASVFKENTTEINLERAEKVIPTLKLLMGG
ncbi:MAG: DUF5682 family protein [Bacteroidota bacterium]